MGLDFLPPLPSETAVFSGCFFVVAAFAQRLPVARVPEQNLVALVWNLVVDDCCNDELAARLVDGAERMLTQESFTGFLPLATVAALVSVASLLVGLSLLDAFVLDAAAGSVAHQRPASRVGAGSWGCCGHKKTRLRWLCGDS